MRGIKSVLSVSALFILAACGGGGGGGDDNPPPAPPAQNAAPTVNAGADTSATLPNATVSLTGSATDDGPAASLTYQWTANPTTGVSFSAATSAATSVTFTTAGPYTLTLTANDGTLSGSDQVTVTVNDVPAQTVVWPADDDDSDAEFHGWAKVEASAVGMTQGGLDAAEDVAIAVPADINPPGGGSGMIVRHGQLVHLWGDIDVKVDMKSVTKSMGGVVLGLAMAQKGVVLEDTGIKYMPTFGTPPNTNATRAQLVTIAQLATHTAGFQKRDGNFTAEIIFDPGTKWSYSDAGLNWLADVLTTVYQEDLAAVAQREVWSKIGLNPASKSTDDVTWRANDHRLPPIRNGIQFRELASGINANTNAMARVGLLFLRKGKWKDQQVLSEDFTLTKVRTPLPQNADLPVEVDVPGQLFPNAPKDYGVLWWTNKSKTMANVPEDTFWAWGLGEELIVVIPSLDLVIVRNGGQSATITTGVRTWNDVDWDGDVRVLEPFLNPIVAATTP
jgi:CubicO group peptidase (beta-lactamase class C family)